MNFFVQESYIDATQNVCCGESDVYETSFSNSGELYRSCLQEYGRCVGKVRIDRTNGTVKVIGWVFQKRKKYDDCDESYLAETWITVHEKPPTKTITHYYAQV